MTDTWANGVKGAPPWRVGSKVGRTIYDANNDLIGVMDDPALARTVVNAVNRVLTRTRHERDV